MDATATVDAYLAAWNEPHADTRIGLLVEAFGEHGTYRDPMYSVSGRGSVIEHIAGFQQRFPRTLMKRVSRVDAYGDVLRFAWAMIGDDSTTVLEGVDFVSLDKEGKIASVTGFFGTLD
jgi:SnoaL-like domain